MIFEVKETNEVNEKYTVKCGEFRGKSMSHLMNSAGCGEVSQNFNKREDY